MHNNHHLFVSGPTFNAELKIASFSFVSGSVVHSLEMTNLLSQKIMKNVSPCISVLPEGGLPFLFSTVYHVSFSTYLCDDLFLLCWLFFYCSTLLFLLFYLSLPTFLVLFLFLYCSCFLVIAVIAFFALRMGFPGRI